MTFSDIRTYVWSLVDDVSSNGIEGTYFTTAQINVFINLAQREVQKKLVSIGELYYQEMMETLTVAGQSDYILPDNVLKIYRLENIIQGTVGTSTEIRTRLEQISQNQQFKVGNGLSNPAYYAIVKNRLRLFPTPQTAGQTLRIYYAKVVADLSNDADIPDVPLEFQEYIAVLAALDCFIKDDRVPNNLLVKQKMYEDMINKIAQERAEDSPRMIIDMDGATWGQGWGVW